MNRITQNANGSVTRTSHESKLLKWDEIVEGLEVSTVSIAEGYETAVFRERNIPALEIKKYDTKEEALEGHENLVRKYRG